MGGLAEYFLVAIAAIFVIINPLTTAFVFASLTSECSPAESRQIAKRAVITATAVLFTFALLGSVIFQTFGITLAAFRIAGGLILFGIAMGMLQRSEAADHKQSHANASGRIADDIAIVPLAIPFISGPGAIATTMILTSEAPSRWYVILVFVAVLVTTVSCYFAMANSGRVIGFLGESGRKILTKVFGLILAVIAVQFVINGVADAVTDYLRSLPQP
ncbi:MAG: MarC family protein [Xanthomonadaceae bacterium]|nr:MarC family protein [Xanthomonadaceae bacterium]